MKPTSTSSSSLTCRKFSGSRLSPLFFGALMGLGVGLATDNVAVGLGIGAVFAAIWTAQRRGE